MTSSNNFVCGDSPCEGLRFDLKFWTANGSPLDNTHQSPGSKEKQSEERRKLISSSTKRKPLDLGSDAASEESKPKQMRFTLMVPDVNDKDDRGDASVIDRFQFENEELKEELKNAKEQAKALKEKIEALERENGNIKRWAAHIVQAGVSMMSGQSGHK